MRLRMLGVVVIVFVLFVQQPAHSQTTTALTVGTELGKSVIDSGFLNKIFDWITSKPPAAERAKPSIRALYLDLLNLRTAREILKDELHTRLQNFNDTSCGIECDQITTDASRLGELLYKFGIDYGELAIALDQGTPDLWPFVCAYRTPNGTVAAALKAGNVRALSKQQVKDYYDALVKNTDAFNKVLETYRAFVKLHYPDALELAGR